MRRYILSLFLLMTSSALFSQDKITFMPSWLPQAQAAGYYAALVNGFYAQEGIDVNIKHMDPNSSKPSMQRLSEGEVDIISSHPIQALIAISKGIHVKNVMQLTQTSGIMIVSHTPIESPESLNGMKIGLWKAGFNETCGICAKANDLNVQFVHFLGGISLFMSGAVDASVVMCYNEYYSLLEAMGEIKPECTLKLSEFGYDIPEDGLYCLDSYVTSHPDIVDKFIRASQKGWNWCVEHPEEAVDIVMSYIENSGVLTNRYHQKRMLEGMFGIMTNRFSGAIDYEPVPRDLYDALVKALVRYDYLPEVISYNEFMR